MSLENKSLVGLKMFPKQQFFLNFRPIPQREGLSSLPLCPPWFNTVELMSCLCVPGINPEEAHGEDSESRYEIPYVCVFQKVLYAHFIPHLPFSNSLQMSCEFFLCLIWCSASLFIMLCHWEML